jgi:hypothetical protein
MYRLGQERKNLDVEFRIWDVWTLASAMLQVLGKKRMGKHFFFSK